MSPAVQYDVISPFMLTSWLKGKNGWTGGRKNMSNRVQKLVKFIPFIVHLNDFPHIMLF